MCDSPVTDTFKYDPFGRRIYKSSASGTSIFAYDGDKLSEETNAVGGVVARYSQGLSLDEPLAELRSGSTSYYEADGLGSVTSLSNAAGTIANNYTYDSFGNLVALSGSIINNFRYTAHEFDTETSLYYYRARYYDTNLGRFLSEDPISFSGGIDFYAYVYNNAVNRFDPFGMQDPIPVPRPTPIPAPGAGPAPTPNPIPQLGPWPGFPFLPEPQDEIPAPPNCGDACRTPNYSDPGPPPSPRPPALPPDAYDKTADLIKKANAAAKAPAKQCDSPTGKQRKCELKSLEKVKGTKRNECVYSCEGGVEHRTPAIWGWKCDEYLYINW